MDTLGQVAGERLLSKLNSILRNPSHPLQALMVLKHSTVSKRLIVPRRRTEDRRESFLPTATGLYNAGI